MNESKKREEIKAFPPLPLPAARIAGLVQLKANISWTPRRHKIHDAFASPDHPHYFNIYHLPSEQLSYRKCRISPASLGWALSKKILNTI